MKLTVISLCLLVATVGVFGEPGNGQGANASNTGTANTAKRESNDETVIGDKSSVQSYHQSIPQHGYFLAAAGPQISYARPDGGIHYASNGYRGSYLTQAPILIPQVAFAAPSPEVKSAGAPIQVAYAHPGPFQYAIAIAPPGAEVRPSGLLQQSAAIPVHGQHIQFALAHIPQHMGQIVKGGGVAYAQMPQVAFLAAPSYAKVAAPAPAPAPASASAPQILSAPQAPAYAYSIQPSIQVAAAKQVITPTAAVASQQYKHLVAPQATSYATFSQQLPTANGGHPVKVSSVVSQPTYATTAAPIYSSPKVTYRSIGPSVQDALAAYSPPSSIYYGSHLYHPSLAKFANLLSQKYY